MKRIALFFLTILIVSSLSVLSAIESKKGSNFVQRQASGAFDLQKNSVSNIDFYTTNYGTFGYNVEQNRGGCSWPRGSENQYLFASGFWFGAKKKSPNDTLRKYCTISYDQNWCVSWFIPGMIQDGDSVLPNSSDRYRVYFSTDFDPITGIPAFLNDGPNWPIWIGDSLGRYQLGIFPNEYINDINKRNKTSYPLGPMFISDEDIVSIMKDTDLSKYGDGAVVRKSQGYPLGLEVESRIYSWGSNDLKDVLIQSILFKNKSKDTLKECWLGGFYEHDIAQFSNSLNGAGNDKCRFIDEDTLLNLAIGWTDTTYYDSGRGFGYIGICMLESPATDANGFIRKDGLIFPLSKQLGLKTFRNHNIETFISTDEERYNYMSSEQLDGDNGRGNKSMLLATGPFNMLPGDNANFALIIGFAMPAKGGEADGTFEDLTGIKKITGKNNAPNPLALNSSLVGKIQTVKEKYYQYIISHVRERIIRPSTISIKSITPNPVSELSVINYQLSVPGNIRMSLYNESGQEVVRLKDGWQDAGEFNYQLLINNYELNSGMYYLRLQQGNDSKIEKMVIVK